MSIAKRGVYKRLFFVGIIHMWITNLTFELVRGIIKSELNSFYTKEVYNEKL